MYEFQNKIVKVFTSKFVGTGPSSYKKRSYRAAVSQRLRNTELEYKSVTALPSLIRGVCYSVLMIKEVSANNAKLLNGHPVAWR